MALQKNCVTETQNVCERDNIEKSIDNMQSIPEMQLVLEVQSRNVKFPFNTLHYINIMSLAFAYYFQIQSFQNKTQEVSNFCSGWLSSDDDDEWLTSSLQPEFMKDFNVEEVCMNENVVSSYKIKNIILTKYFQYFSAATIWPHHLTCHHHLK